MTYAMEWQCAFGNVTLEGENPISLNESPFLVFYSALKTIAPLLSAFEFRKTVNPNEYKYELTATDGRIWKQKIMIVPGQEATMNFNVVDQWKLSEFEPHRVLRNSSIELVLLGVSKIVLSTA